MKHNKRGNWIIGINRGFFVYFDPNDVNTSTFDKQSCNLWKRKKVLKQCENQFFQKILTLGDKYYCIILYMIYYIYIYIYVYKYIKHY